MKDKLLIWLGDKITKYRYAFLVLFSVFFIVGLINLNNVKINESLTDYLPEKTETKEGIKIMEKEYGALISIDAMVSGVSEKEALSYYEDFQKIDNVDLVMFSLSDKYYKDNNALYKFELVNKSAEDANRIKKDIESITKNKDTYIYSDTFEDPTQGVTTVLILVVAIIFLVLISTSKTYFEVVIAFIILGISIVLNMGSNFIFGEISYITKAIAVVLQLALSIDYVIIFMNQFMKEIDDTTDKKLAIKKTLSKSIPEIFASSLTTVSGLIVLIFMQFKLGGDIGIVLSKGILCSFLTVILVMPCLLDIFTKQILKFKKKEIKKANVVLNSLSNFIVKYKFVLLPIYVVLIFISILCINNYDYAFNLNSTKAFRVSDNIKSLDKIQETFGKDNTLLVLVENKEKDFNKEKELTDELGEVDGVISSSSITSYKISDDISLFTSLDYKTVSSLLDIDPEIVKSLYLYYANVNNENITDIDKYNIPIINLANFIKNNTDKLNIDASTKLKLLKKYGKKFESYSFLESSNYSRIILSLDSNVESSNTLKIVKNIREVTNKYYSNSLLVGNSINAYDLKSTFTSDNIKITFVTILFIAIILLISFRSFGMAILLILTIEGSILVNFGLVTLTNHKIFFISYIVVSAIQMGATIDYAIVIASRYMQLRKKQDKKDAILGTLKDRLPAVITSGLILLSAGFLVGTITTSSCISSIGLFLGLGTLISLLATILFLPAILYTFDKFISKTTMK
ncbi:MAG: MMPL family transporter [Bacilli bacterium]|nr:MMPL family transporter [Bacilli bacterium]